jgi:choline-sulfatase
MRLLFLDLDTLRPDHLGCYGYTRATSPNIDRIAGEGVRFDEYYCSDAPCLPSRAALITGQHGIHTGVINHGGLCADLRPEGASRGFTDRLRNGSLWGHLWRHNIHTASISSFGGRHSAWWFHAGLNEVHDIGWGGGESAEQVTPIALDWIQRNARRDNWCLHVNYWDPHTPYRVPAEFGNPFADTPLPQWITPAVLADWKNQPGGHSAWDFGMWKGGANPKYPRQPDTILDLAGVRGMIDGYDTGIRYMDDHIGRLLNALAAEGVLDDLAIIVSSDHGENLGELNCCAEHGTSDRITHRIPMIFRWPGRIKAGGVDSGLHYNLDLAPTLADLLNFEPAKHWDGRSYAPSLTDGIDTGREALILSQCCHGCQRSVRWGDWLYIRTYHDFYHLYPPEMLFNIRQDPHEQYNLALQHPELCASAAHRYLDWHDSMMSTMGDDTDPLWTVMKEGGPFHSRGFLPDYCKRLEATGRGWAIPELKRRHPGEFA